MQTPFDSPTTRVAITGAGGFLGTQISRQLHKYFPVRLMDIHPIPGDWESVTGSVSDLNVAMELCNGCSDLVIAHMAPNRPEIYENPVIPFDINVTGTANLFHAAIKCGLRRVILISSITVVRRPHQKGNEFLPRDHTLHAENIYGLTKWLQEDIARYYHELTGIPVAIFRPAYICDEDSLSDKYGNKRPSVNWQFIDPRDIAEAVRLSLIVPDLSFETFYILGHPDADEHVDMKHTRDFLTWKPSHTFEKYPLDAK